jgi:Pheromone A receptor
MSRDPALSFSQTIRPIILSMSLGIPGALWAAGNYQQLGFVGLKPFPDWSTMHKHANRIEKETEGQLSPMHTTSLLIRWWSIFAQAYIVFFLFGTSKDLLRDYQIIWVLFKARVFKQPLQETTGWKTKSSMYEMYGLPHSRFRWFTVF